MTLSAPDPYGVQAPPTLSFVIQSTLTTSTIASVSTQLAGLFNASSISGNGSSILTASRSNRTEFDTTSEVKSVSTFVQLAAYASKPTALAFVIPTALINTTDYQQLCPQGDCYKDCQNLTRVFESLPDGINSDPASYGKAPTGGFPDVTLFGVCTNLATMTDWGLQASFFPKNDTVLRIVNSDISTCLLDTCQKTRDPKQCMNSCKVDQLLSGNATLSAASILPCMNQLCALTCGLPYANQDVFGVGLLASYITQAILVLILAAVIMTSATWRSVRHKKPNAIPFRDGLESFLAAQCYFGISAVIASYFMRPSAIDSLNGYALLSVSITGFLPTTFTLMLLHSHGIKSWYITFLTCVSWVISSALFFVLVKHLTEGIGSQRMLDEGLNSLFSIPTCGGSSAMSLCRQMFDTDPMSYLSYAYNYWTFPSIKYVSIIWMLPTIVLSVLITVQLCENVAKRDRRLNPIVTLGFLYLGSILFGLALGSQARMVIAYAMMDVIDWDGWTFGQVVALLFWVPALLDCVRSYLRQLKNKQRQHLNSGKSNSISSTDTTTTSPFVSLPGHGSLRDQQKDNFSSVQPC